ncbi:MAG: response regulator [Oxalobacteraceae bacterium]|nr:MAG: response regulator [Oxalobacteraceae bacterium]
MRPIRRKRLRHLLLQFAAIGLVPISLMAAWAIWDAVDRQQTQLSRSTLEMSRALATAVESEISGTLSSLATAGRSPLLGSGDLPKFYEQMKAEAEVRPDWLGIVLTDAKAQVLFKTAVPFGAEDARIVDPESLQQVLQTGKPAIGRLLPGSGGRLAFPVRWPVVHDGQLRYVITAAVTPDRILEVVQKQQVPSGWIVSVFDGAGRRVARSKNQEGTLGGSGSPSVVALLAAHGASGAGLTRSIEGDDVITSFTRLQPEGWSVVVGAPVSEAGLTALRGLAIFLGGVLVSVLVCAALALRFSSAVAHVINRLRLAAIDMGEAASLKVSRSRIVELDELADAVRAASDRLFHSRAAMEEALHRADENAQARDQFLAMVGHELRNPLVPMVNVLHLLDRKADPSTVRERQILGRQVQHMRRLVDDLLDISRVSRGNLVVHKEPVSLSTVVDRALGETQQPKGATAISVTLPPEPVWVLGDEIRLVQALTNLLVNALKFGKNGRVALQVTTLDDQVDIEVIDQGVGMSPETIERIFEPFYQSPQSIARSDGGLGLGLAIVRTVMQAHGGSATASSEGPGKGSVFRLSMPTIEAPTARVDPDTHPEPRATARVLLVDDNQDVLDPLAELLCEAGYRVETANDPLKGLRLLETFVPDVVILDIGMPEMDGYRFAKIALDSDRRWSDRLVALTGYGQEADKASAMEAGFAAHLTKPADPAVLLDLVAEIAARNT